MDFSTFTHEEKNINGKDFSLISLENFTFTNCSFQKCNFTESLLRNTKFCSCTFKECNLSLTKLDGCRLQDSEFLDSKIVGAEFFKCEKNFFFVTYRNCLLQYCNFSDLTIKNANFSGSKLKECYFTNTGLKNANFTDVDLTGTVFHNCDLSHADFSSAINYFIDPVTNKIKKAKFSLPEAMGLLNAFDIKII